MGNYDELRSTKFIDYTCINTKEHKKIAHLITVDNFEHFQDLLENNNIMDNLFVYLHHDIIIQYKNFCSIKEKWIYHNYEWFLYNKNYLLDDFCLFECKNVNSKIKIYKLNDKIFDNLIINHIKIDDLVSIILKNKLNVNNKLKIIKHLVKKFDINIDSCHINYTINNEYFELFKYLIYITEFKFKNYKFFEMFHSKLKIKNIINILYI